MRKTLFVLGALSLACAAGCAGQASIADAGARADAASRDAGRADDAATRLDASADPAAASDASSDAAMARDATTSDASRDASRDAASCDPSAISFPMGGSLMEGQLCDDVFACVAGPTEAMALRAASGMTFECDAAPKGPCSGWTCVYRNPGGPSTLDAMEIADICAVTVLSPRPTLVCRIYL